MCCRTGVKKHLKGGSLPFDPTEKILKSGVWDRQKKGYRLIDLTTCAFIRVRGMGYLPNSEPVNMKENSISILLGKI